MNTFCQKSKLMDGDELPQFNIGTSDRLYIAATNKNSDVEIPEQVTVRGPTASPDQMQTTNDMLRYEFIEMLVRIAKAKYIETGLRERY